MTHNFDPDKYDEAVEILDKNLKKNGNGWMGPIR